MELKKCESCEKVFFGEQSLRLCPICTVAERSKEVIRRQQPDRVRSKSPVPALAVAR